MKYNDTDERYKNLKKGQEVTYLEDNSKGKVLGFSVYGCVIDWGVWLHGEGSRTISTEPASVLHWEGK